MFSRILGILLTIAIIVGGVMYKVQVIQKNNAREEVTIASIHQMKGTPVHVDKVQFGPLPKLIKPTIKVLPKGMVSILIPADTRPFVEKMKNAAIYIDDKKFIAYNGTLSPKSQDYTGFIEVNAKMKPALPWPVGQVLVGRAPFDLDQKYTFIPNEAIFQLKSDRFVYVVVDEHLVKRSIDIIFSTHKFTAIGENGPKVGDMVVVSDQRDLSDGEKVHAIVNL